MWDYKNHNQFELKVKHFKRIKELSKGTAHRVLRLSAIDKELINANIISDQPYPPFEWKWDELGLMYHIGTQNIYRDPGFTEEEWINDYLDFCKTVDTQGDYQFISYLGPKTSLPKPDLSHLETTSLLKSFKERMTSRSFNGQQVSLKELSSILYVSFGLLHGEWEELDNMNLKSLGIRKAHPSGGGLHPVEAYVLVFNVQDMSPGIYHYNVQHHHLTHIAKACTFNELQKILGDQFFGNGIAFGVFLVAHFKKVWHKYGHSRSYKDVYLDAGHVSQTFLLSATAFNLLTWKTSWFNDSDVAALLNIDGISTAPLFFLGVGYGEKCAIPPKLEKIIKGRDKAES